MLFVRTLAVLIVPAVCAAAGITVTILDYPGAGTTFIDGIANNGVIVGRYSLNSASPGPQGPLTPFTYDGTTFRDFAVPLGYNQFQTRGINSLGHITGNALNLSTQTVDVLFITQSGFIDIAPGIAEGLNDLDQVIFYGFDDINHMWQNGSFVDVPYPNGSIFYGINTFGHVVGNGSQGGFLNDTPGVPSNDVRIATPPFSPSFRNDAYGINDKDHVVGLAEGANNPAFLWYPGGSYTTFAPPNSPNTTFVRTIALGINNQETIVGTAFDGQTYHGFQGTGVITPEPTTALLAFVGVGLLAWRLTG